SAPRSSRVCCDGEEWNCTTSRWSVFIRTRLCSTPATTLSRVKTCCPRWPRGAGGAPTRQPPLLARRFTTLRAFCPALRQQRGAARGLGGGVDLVAQVDLFSAAP